MHSLDDDELEVSMESNEGRAIEYRKMYLPRQPGTGQS